MANSNRRDKSHMMKRYNALFAAVHEVFIRDWDPIGVGDCPEAQDEYDSYIPVVVRMLLEGADGAVIANHLTKLQTIEMGLPPLDEGEENRKIADSLTRLAE